jgi:histidinol-phosphate aminotransferase
MDNLFIIRSFSKVYGLAGIRAGYGIGHPDLIELIHRIKPPFNVSITAQTVAMAALKDNGFAQKTIDNLKQEKGRYYQALDELGLSYVRSHTNFVLIDIGRDAADLVSRLLREGIIVRPAKGFGLPNCIRVTIGTPAENKQFIQALKKLIGRI